MSNKGFTDEQNNISTPNDVISPEKPLKTEKKEKGEQVTTNRVDINVLKSRIQERQNKEYKQNITIFVFFLITLGTLGIYLST